MDTHEVNPLIRSCQPEFEKQLVRACLKAELSEITGAARRRHGDPQRPEPGLFRTMLHRIRQLNQSLRPRQHVPAERCEIRPASGTVEQPLAVMALQRGDPATRHRLANTDRRRTSSEAAELAHAHESPATTDEIHHPTLCLFGMELPITVLDGMTAAQQTVRIDHRGSIAEE